MGKADGTSAEAPSAEQKESKPQPEEVQKEDVESLRKVIKLDQKEEEASEEPEKEEEPEDLTDVTSMIEEENPQPVAPASTREELEQKRAILQRIKDFDFQIKKNQQDINTVTEKINSLSKDLDDLVSLYEIVSEQMNPFVGLSKVTRKRLESLENITHEIDDIKERLSYMDLGGGAQIPKPLQPEAISTYETDLTDEQVERIIEVSFSGISLDQTIDNAIDGFIESLKAGKVN